MDLSPEREKGNNLETGDVEESDNLILEGCRQGDPNAWEHLLGKYERLVYSIPLNYGLTKEDAADITQTTFITLLQSLDTLRDETRLANWLITVTRRHTWRWLSHGQREGTSPNSDLAEIEQIIDANKDLEKWEQIIWLNDGLNQLKKLCRELILALYFDPNKPSYSEIARRFKMPVGSVGPNRARCLEQLKQVLSTLRESPN